jgi:hypothetical protein
VRVADRCVCGQRDSNPDAVIIFHNVKHMPVNMCLEKTGSFSDLP